MALTDIEIRNAKKPGKLTDGRGLHLLVKDGGAKLWRFNYRFAGKYRTLALGQYPQVKLSEARNLDEARRLLQQQVDPSEKRRQDKVAGKVAQVNTFGAIAQEYLDRLREQNRAEATLVKNSW